MKRIKIALNETPQNEVISHFVSLTILKIYPWTIPHTLFRKTDLIKRYIENTYLNVYDDSELGKYCCEETATMSEKMEKLSQFQNDLHNGFLKKIQICSSEMANTLSRQIQDDHIQEFVSELTIFSLSTYNKYQKKWIGQQIKKLKVALKNREKTKILAISIGWETALEEHRKLIVRNFNTIWKRKERKHVEENKYLERSTLINA